MAGVLRALPVETQTSDPLGARLEKPVDCRMVTVLPVPRSTAPGRAGTIRAIDTIAPIDHSATLESTPPRKKTVRY